MAFAVYHIAWNSIVVEAFFRFGRCPSGAVERLGVPGEGRCDGGLVEATQAARVACGCQPQERRNQIQWSAIRICWISVATGHYPLVKVYIANWKTTIL